MWPVFQWVSHLFFLVVLCSRVDITVKSLKSCWLTYFPAYWLIKQMCLVGLRDRHIPSMLNDSILASSQVLMGWQCPEGNVQRAVWCHAGVRFSPWRSCIASRSWRVLCATSAAPWFPLAVNCAGVVGFWTGLQWDLLAVIWLFCEEFGFIEAWPTLSPANSVWFLLHWWITRI